MMVTLNIKKLRAITIVLMCLPAYYLCAKRDTYENEKEKFEPPRIGNFALPTAQQPSSFISIGQNIVDERDLKWFLYGSYFKGHKELFAEVIPSALYGIKDNLSVLIGLPIAVKFKQNNRVVQGPEDFFVQFEGVIYGNEQEERSRMITLIANIGAPTGLGLDTSRTGGLLTDAPSGRIPTTGAGAFSLFFGFTAVHMDAIWHYFCSGGASLALSHKGTQAGSYLLYQAGLGRNIWYSPDRWILNWLVELNGHYAQRDIIKRTLDCDSGGNQILLGPSLFLSGQHITIQAGIALVINQNLFGDQNKDEYLAAINVGWKF